MLLGRQRSIEYLFYGVLGLESNISLKLAECTLPQIYIHLEQTSYKTLFIVKLHKKDVFGPGRLDSWRS